MRLWAGLHDRKKRQEAGLALAEGARVAQEALRAHGRPGAPWQVETVVLENGREAEAPAAAVLAAAAALGVRVARLATGAYARITSLKAPDGVAVVLRPSAGVLAGTALLEYFWQRPDACLLAAVGLQDPGNAGALARVAEAAGATGLALAGGVDTAHPRFLRGAMGSAFRLPCAGVTEADLLALWMAPGPMRRLAACAKGAVGMARADWRPPMILLVGGEGGGIPEAFMDGAAAVSVPMSGEAESLNVAVAAGVLLYTARGQWAVDG